MGEPGGGGLTWEMRLALAVAAVASAYLGSTVLKLCGVRDALVFVLAFPAWVAAHAVAGVLERGGSMWVALQRWKGRRDRGSSSGARKANGREVRHMAILVEQERVSNPDGSRKVAEVVAWALAAGAQFVSVFDPGEQLCGDGAARRFLAQVAEEVAAAEGDVCVLVATNGRPAGLVAGGEYAAAGRAADAAAPLRALHLCGAAAGRESVVRAARRVCGAAAGGRLPPGRVGTAEVEAAVWRLEGCEAAGCAGRIDCSGWRRAEAGEERRATRGDAGGARERRTALELWGACYGACGCAVQLPEAEMAVRFGPASIHTSFMPCVPAPPPRRGRCWFAWRARASRGCRAAPSRGCCRTRRARRLPLSPAWGITLPRAPLWESRDSVGREARVHEHVDRGRGGGGRWHARLTEFFDAGDLARVDRARLDGLLARFAATQERLGT